MSDTGITPVTFPFLSALLIDSRDNLVSALPEGQCSPHSGQQTTYRGQGALECTAALLSQTS